MLRPRSRFVAIVAERAQVLAFVVVVVAVDMVHVAARLSLADATHWLLLPHQLAELGPTARAVEPALLRVMRFPLHLVIPTPTQLHGECAA
jgi:hypothetical protein